MCTLLLEEAAVNPGEVFCCLGNPASGVICIVHTWNPFHCQSMWCTPRWPILSQAGFLVPIQSLSFSQNMEFLYLLCGWQRTFHPLVVLSLATLPFLHIFCISWSSMHASPDCYHWAIRTLFQKTLHVIRKLFN